MFVFSSLIVVSTWFLSRLAWDRLLPTWRARADRLRRRFALITLTGALVAGAVFGAAVASHFDATAGLVAAAVLIPVYCFIAVVLFVLLDAFDVRA